jgi:type III secretory pathway component EscS
MYLALLTFNVLYSKASSMSKRYHTEKHKFINPSLTQQFLASYSRTLYGIIITSLPSLMFACTWLYHHLMSCIAQPDLCLNVTTHKSSSFIIPSFTQQILAFYNKTLYGIIITSLPPFPHVMYLALLTF